MYGQPGLVEWQWKGRGKREREDEKNNHLKWIISVANSWTVVVAGGWRRRWKKNRHSNSVGFHISYWRCYCYFLQFSPFSMHTFSSTLCLRGRYECVNKCDPSEIIALALEIYGMVANNVHYYTKKATTTTKMKTRRKKPTRFALVKRRECARNVVKQKKNTQNGLYLKR